MSPESAVHREIPKLYTLTPPYDSSAETSKRNVSFLTPKLGISETPNVRFQWEPRFHVQFLLTLNSLQALYFWTPRT